MLRPKPGRPHRSINAIVPIVVLVATVISGLYVTGEGDSIRDIIGSADSSIALMWGALLGAATAFR